MSMQVGPSGGGEEFDAMSTINTTPLVDIMLVLLIIFLLTIPVVVKTVKLDLPQATNQALITKPENVVIAVNKVGRVYWNNVLIRDYEELLDKLRETAVMVPQPEVHIRGDQHVNYEFIGRVLVLAQRSGILKVGFITEPIIGGGLG
jgi:biopolymer transport protein ExbD